ncbi:MAG: sigma-70 family RNA polymerase sigma factor [Gemmataceae bacterium]
MTASLGYVLSQLQRWTSSGLEELSDAVLLERFVRQRDESAFAALTARHGAMVLRSCRRILGDAHDAEDAFQATFLILARKAHTLRKPAALPGFLHSVARRVALKSRSQAANRGEAMPINEKSSTTSCDPLTQLTARELLEILDEEIARLPSAQRSAVILCCLEGQTREEAARILGCTQGSLKGRLERGRQRLQERLRRRGVALSAALSVAAVCRGEAASALLIRSTVTAALSGGIGSSAAVLAHSVLKMFFLTKLAWAMTVVLTVALAASTAVVLVQRGPVAEAPEDEILAVPAAPKEAEAARTDAQGDPLPEGAIARLGTVRLRHCGNISMVKFTPDGKRLVSQGGDGVRVWDTASGKEVRHLSAPGGSDLSPDGKCIATVNLGPGHLELWDMDSGKKIAAFGENCYAPIRFSPDGKLLATLSTDTKVEIWEVESRKKLRSWKVPAKHVFSLAFSADSRQLLTNGLYDMIRVWDVTTGKELQGFLPLATSSGEISLPSSPAISPDGKLVALAEANSKRASSSGKVEWKARVSLRDLASNKLMRELTCPAYEIAGQQLPFRDLTFTPDGKSLVTSGPDRNIRFWDAETGKELRRLSVEGLPGPLTLSRDGKKLAVVMAFGTAIRILDLKSGQATPSFGHLMPISLAAVTPDGQTALTGSLLGPVFIWDAATGRLRRRIDGHKGVLDTLQVGGDGRTLFTSGLDNTVRVWDVATAAEQRSMAVERDASRTSAETGNRYMVVTPDGKTLATINAGKTIRILDAVSGSERQHFQGPESLLGMGLTPDGRSLIAWSGDLKVRVWDTATGRKLREYPLPLAYDDDVPRIPNEYYNAALSRDGRLLAMGPVDHRAPRNPQEMVLREKKGDSVIFKDLAMGQIVHRLSNLPSEAALMAFSPDGRMLAWTGSKDSAIRLLETASGRERRLLTGHRGRITALAFSADGRRLLSGCNDTTALVWDLGGGWAPRPATASELESLWADLAGEDAARAYQAIHKLADSPTPAIPFLRKCLRPVAAVDAKYLADLIAGLDSNDFAAREKSTVELQKLGEQALLAYRKALEGKPSLESRRRLYDLLDKAQRAWWAVSGERLRSLRAVEVLELANTKAAREALKTLAAGAAGARLTEDAKAALQRLGKQEQR